MAYLLLVLGQKLLHSLKEVIPMIEISTNELKQKLNIILAHIEKGEKCIVIKEGKPIAEIAPLENSSPSWKRRVEKITLPNGLSVQDYVEAERNY